MSALYVSMFVAVVITVTLTVYSAYADSSIGGQTMKDSIKESWTNIFIGFGINWMANMVVLPMAGLVVSGGTAFNIGVVFTAISIVRSFIIRRLYNAKTSRSNI